MYRLGFGNPLKGSKVIFTKRFSDPIAQTLPAAQARLTLPRMARR